VRGGGMAIRASQSNSARAVCIREIVVLVLTTTSNDIKPQQ
jgi:hypothetical protein